MENRVVITGLGIWSSIGTSLGEVTESLREGRSGIGLDPERRELGYISALTGIVKRPELKGALDRRKRLCLPQQGEYARSCSDKFYLFEYGCSDYNCRKARNHYSRTRCDVELQGTLASHCARQSDEGI